MISEDLVRKWVVGDKRVRLVCTVAVYVTKVDPRGCVTGTDSQKTEKHENCMAWVATSVQRR